MITYQNFLGYVHYRQKLKMLETQIVKIWLMSKFFSGNTYYFPSKFNYINLHFSKFDVAETPIQNPSIVFIISRLIPIFCCLKLKLFNIILKLVFSETRKLDWIEMLPDMSWGLSLEAFSRCLQLVWVRRCRPVVGHNSLIGKALIF